MNKGIPKRKNKIETIDEDTRHTSTIEMDVISLPLKKNQKKQDQNVGKKKEVIGDKLSRSLDRIKSLESKILILEKENGNLISKSKRLEDEYGKYLEEKERDDNLMKEMKRKAESAENLQKQLIKLQGDLNEMIERTSAAEAALVEKESLLNDIKNNTQSSHYELQYLIQEKEKYNQEIQNKNQIISQNENEIESLKENIEKLNMQNQELSSQIILSETENDSIAKKLTDKTKELDQVRNELASLNEKLDKLNEEILSKQKEIIVLKQKNEEATMNYQSTCANQINENTQLKSTIREKDIIISDSKKQISLMAKNIKELENNLSEITNEKDALSQKYNEDFQKLQDSISTIKTQERKIESLNQMIQDKENEKKNLKVHYDQMQSLLQNQNDENKSSLLSTIEKQQNQISKQCEEIDCLKIKLSDANSLNLDLQDKIKIVNQDSSLNKNKYDDYLSKYEKLQSDFRKINVQLSKQQNENDKLNSEINSLTQEINESNSQIAALTNENQNLQDRINYLTETADQINGDNDRLKAQTNENKELHSRCNELERVNELYHKQIEKANQENIRIKAKLSEKEKEIVEIQSKKSLEDNSLKIHYTQRIIELEEELKTYRQSPTISVTESKLKVYEEHVKKLNTKLQALQAEYNKKEIKHFGHQPSGEKLMIQSQKAKIQEMERIIDNLKFENQVLANSQALENQWKERFEENVKRDVESHEDLKKCLLQIRYRIASGIENPQNQM